MNRKNPGASGSAFKRCVKSVSERGGAYSPSGVCAAAGRKKYGKKKFQAMAAAGRQKNIGEGDYKGYCPTCKRHSPDCSKECAREWVKAHRELHSSARVVPVKRRSNPAGEAAEAYAEFHGRPSEEVVTITREVHFHAHLAALGRLEKLHVETHQGQRVVLSGFGKKCLLCQNEKGTQLFIEGGDQSVNVRDFGVSAPHEREDLGCVRKVEYFTTKDHLGNEGGTAIYVHDFRKPLPHLIYDTINQQLEFAGGQYVILPEGIDN